MSPGTPLSAPKKVAPSPELRARASEPPQGTAWPPSEKRSLSRRGRDATQESKPRRPKGTGSVYVRDGVVIGQYEVRTPDDRIGRKYVRGKDKKEVAGRLAKAIADRDSGLVYDSGRTTVGEYLDAAKKVRPLDAGQVKKLLVAAPGATSWRPSTSWR